MNERTAKVVGTPREGVTHWGIGRVVNNKTTRLDFPNDENIRVKEWPIETLDIDEIRSRWGAGSYRVQWLAPDNPDVQRRALGWGSLFTLDPEQGTHVAAPPGAPPVAIATAPGGVSADSLLQVMTTMMTLSDKRADSMISAVMNLAAAGSGNAPAAVGVAVSEEMAKLRAEVASTNARLDAEKREREITEKHRAELAAKDAEIARLERAKEDAEREARDAERSEPPRIEPGSPLLSQIGFGIANAALAKPELVGKLLEVAAPIVENLMGKIGKAEAPAPPPPSPVPPPRAMPAVVPPVVPPVVAKADPSTSSWQPIPKAEEKKTVEAVG